MHIGGHHGDLTNPNVCAKFDLARACPGAVCYGGAGGLTGRPAQKWPGALVWFLYVYRERRRAPAALLTRGRWRFFVSVRRGEKCGEKG